MMSKIDYSGIPKGLDYKSKLKSFTDNIRDTRRVTIIPSNNTIYGSDAAQECLIHVKDSGIGSMLKPNSCYLTYEVQTQVAAGTSDNGAYFNSSSNDVIDRITVRGAASRVNISDCRHYNVWSAINDKLRYGNIPDSSTHPISRGFVQRTADFTDASGSAAQTTTHNLGFGLGSRSVAGVAQLNDGNKRYKAELKYCPFFDNDSLIPLQLTGGLEISVNFSRNNDAMVGHKADNDTLETTTKQYVVKNVRFHCEIVYSNDALTKFMAAEMKAGNLAIPYTSYSALQHNPQSTAETLRLSQSLKHLQSVFIVHRRTRDLNNISAASLADFCNPQLTGFQVSSAGHVVPSVELQVGADDGKEYTGDAYGQLEAAAKRSLGYDISKTPLDMTHFNTLATTAQSSGTTAKPVYSDIAKWCGSHIVALQMDGGSKFSSIFNRVNSFNQTGSADLTASFKYAISPSSVPSSAGTKGLTMNAFMVYDNVLQILPNGELIPEQIAF